MSQNDVGFWMLWFDSLSGWCCVMPSTSCSFPHIRSWRRPRAKSNMITSPKFQASRSRNWLEQIVHAATLKTPESQIGIYLGLPQAVISAQINSNQFRLVRLIIPPEAEKSARGQKLRRSHFGQIHPQDISKMKSLKKQWYGKFRPIYT